MSVNVTTQYSIQVLRGLTLRMQSLMLLEMQWAIVHEDVFVFERFIALLEHWTFCIQHENCISSLPSSVFAVY